MWERAASSTHGTAKRTVWLPLEGGDEPRDKKWVREKKGWRIKHIF